MTLPGASNGLLVNDLNSPIRDHDGLWKVSYIFEETPYVISKLAFVRRIDAERARAAIEPIVDWTQSPKAVIAELRSRGWSPASRTQRLAESMQW